MLSCGLEMSNIKFYAIYLKELDRKIAEAVDSRRKAKDFVDLARLDGRIETYKELINLINAVQRQKENNNRVNNP